MSIAYNYAFEMICKNDSHRSTDEVLEIMKECIMNGVDINMNNSIALLDCIDNTYNDNVEIINFLIENGINIHAKNNRALQLACENGDIGVVKLLLNAGANINLGKKPITSYTDITEIIILLIEHGADPFANDGELMFSACAELNLKLVEYLISIGLDVNKPDNKPIIEIFSSRGNKKIKKLLLENGADSNVKNVNGVCLLEHSIMNLDIESCELLFEFGADATMCDNIINMNYKIITRKFGTTMQLEPIIELFRNHNLDIRDFLNELIIK